MRARVSSVTILRRDSPSSPVDVTTKTGSPDCVCTVGVRVGSKR
jgi:hypothetical protein